MVCPAFASSRSTRRLATVVKSVNTAANANDSQRTSDVFCPQGMEPAQRIAGGRDTPHEEKSQESIAPPRHLDASRLLSLCWHRVWRFPQWSRFHEVNILC